MAGLGETGRLCELRVNGWCVGEWRPSVSRRRCCGPAFIEEEDREVAGWGTTTRDSLISSFGASDSFSLFSFHFFLVFLLVLYFILDAGDLECENMFFIGSRVWCGILFFSTKSVR
jgi:hypothetical protein